MKDAVILVARSASTRVFLYRWEKEDGARIDCQPVEAVGSYPRPLGGKRQSVLSPNGVPIQIGCIARLAEDGVTGADVQEYLMPLLTHACDFLLRDEWCHGASELWGDTRSVAVFMMATSGVRGLEQKDIKKYNSLRALIARGVTDFEGNRGIRFKMSRWFPESWEDLSCAIDYHQWILRTHIPVLSICEAPGLQHSRNLPSADEVSLQSLLLYLFARICAVLSSTSGRDKETLY